MQCQSVDLERLYVYSVQATLASNLLNLILVIVINREQNQSSLVTYYKVVHSVTVMVAEQMAVASLGLRNFSGISCFISNFKVGKQSASGWRSFSSSVVEREQANGHSQERHVGHN